VREKAQKFLTDALGMSFPYVSMGKIDSLDLFGPTELMILELYKENQKRWRFVADIGANLGLHSIIMARLGWDVQAYEPDPEIYLKLRANIEANKVYTHIDTHKAAVHTSDGIMNFIRVHNNLTGSHLEGYKDSYGPRNTIQVKTVDCRSIWPEIDFAKIDSEGNEASMSLTMNEHDMSHMSCVMEVRNTQNAQIIYEHFRKIDVPIWAQKVNWKKVQSLDDMPHINREGSIFVGHESPWG
jgi:FkbM family methyltransferase